MDQNSHLIYYNTLLSRYIFYEKLGEGTYGTVYRGYDKQQKRVVAIKEHRKMYDIIYKELNNKWTLWKSLDHPNIVKYIDYWLCKEISTVYVIMEYIDGYTMQVNTSKGNGFEYYSLLLLKQFNPVLYNNNIRNVIYQCISGLYYLHNKRMVHRDIKPANIVLTRNYVPKIVDLDLLCIADEKMKNRLVCEGYNIGTLLYKSPEYCMKKTHISDSEYMKNDVWALGATLYYYYFGHDYLREIWIFLNLQDLNTLIQNLKNTQIIKYPKNNIEVFINWMMTTNHLYRPSSLECYNSIKNICKK